MKTSYIVIGIILFILVLGGCSGVSSYNKMVSLDETVKSKWGTVQADYQRRADLIPNLVSTVKGVANFEKSTLVDVTNARAKATSIQVDPTKLTPGNIQQFQAAQGQLTSALSRLLVASERYPELKANDNFSALQAQLEGTENRIKVSRISITLCRIITPRSGHSRQALLRALAVSSKKDTSRPKQGRKMRQRFNSKLLITPMRF
jgi:LemA protein